MPEAGQSSRNETTASSRFTTRGGKAVGPVHDLFLSDLLSLLLPTHRARHAVKFYTVSGILVVVPVGLVLLRSDDTGVLSSTSFWLVLNGALLTLVAWQVYQTRIVQLIQQRPPWMDPTTASAGDRLSAHFCNLRWHASEGAARAAVVCPTLAHRQDPMSRATPNVWNLDSTLQHDDWEFTLCDTVPAGLTLATHATLETKFQTHLAVPSNWMLRDDIADIPIYTNQKYPIPCEPPLVPIANPTGVYRRRLPEYVYDWTGTAARYYLTLHAFESMVYVYVNQKLVGYAKDSRLPSSWEISSYLQATDNVVTLVVLRWSDGSYLEDQDHWWMAGLHRSVEVIRRPPRANLSSIMVKQASAQGVLDVQVTLFQAVSAATPTSLRWAVYADRPTSPAGTSVQLGACLASTTMTLRSTDITLDWSTRLDNIQAWTAETPHLYTLVVTLVDRATRKVWQVEACRIGFRTVSIVNAQVCVNGRPITVCGMNRHEHDPDTGKVVSLARMHQDVCTLKRHNFNAVRTSHYPQHPSFYKLCDYYGLYVVDEANLETHGMKPMGRLAHDSGWFNTILPRITRMVERDRNHACILWWSLGNEAGRGRNLWKARKTILGMDSTRLVVYESGGLVAEGTGRTELTDVICTMYPDVPRMLRLATRLDEDRPVILCEYSHAMGNSNGNLHLYWNEFWNPAVPRLQGGFIWDYIDQGLRQTDVKTGREYFAYGGDFGDTINDLQFCINGMFTPERDPHPAVAEIKYLMSPVAFLPKESYVDADCLRIKVDMYHTSVRFDVKNRYTFSPLNHLDWSWSLTSNRANGPIRGGTFTVSGSESKLDALVDLDSVLSRVVLLEKSRPASGNSYFLNLQGALKRDATWAKAGYVIVAQQFAVKFMFPNLVPEKVTVRKTPSIPLSWKHEGNTLRIERTVSGIESRTVAIFDKQIGALVSYSPVTDNLLAGPLVPNFTRAATDNDKGGLEQPLEFLFPGMKLQYLFGLLHNLDKFSYWSRWKLVGLDAAAPPAMQCSDMRVKEGTDRTYLDVEVDSEIRCVAQAMTLFHVRIVYRVFTNGRMRVNYHVEPTSAVARITSLPRVGVNLQVLSSFFKMSYFGRGPDENYTDRKTGSFLGHYHTTPADMGYYKYIVPGENGSRSDCEWISFRGGPGDGLLIASTSKKEAFSCSALIYSAAELEQAAHTYDLPERGNGESPIHVNIDHQLMGVGGDTSWYPVVYPEFRVPPDRSYEFGLWLAPLASDDEASLVGRELFAAP